MPPAQIWGKRGIKLLREGKYEGALKALNGSIELAPGDAPVYYYCGLTRVHLGQYDRAIEDFSLAIAASRVMPPLTIGADCFMAGRDISTAKLKITARPYPWTLPFNREAAL